MICIVDKILINGRACSGKDEIADYLVEKYGFVKVTFAEPIYWIARNIFRMKTKNRRLLQIIGQTGRFIYKDIWVVIAYYRANRLRKQGHRTILPDVRQINEYIIGVNNGFLPIRVSATLETRIQRCRERDGIEPDTTLWENDSEVKADNFDYIEVSNNGTKEELYKAIDELLSKMG